MAIFPLSGVLRGFSGCGVQQYASPETLVRPSSTEKFLISESDTFSAHPALVDGQALTIKKAIPTKIGMAFA